MARTLEGILFRVKLASPVPADRNRPDVIQNRLDYANWFMGHAMVNYSVFIDECGYNIWSSRNQGMLLSQWPFDPTMNWFSTVQLLVG